MSAFPGDLPISVLILCPLAVLPNLQNTGVGTAVTRAALDSATATGAQAVNVFGDPDYCVERVHALRREYEMDEFICYFNQGGIMDHATVRASMTLFAREVMPHCR